MKRIIILIIVFCFSMALYSQIAIQPNSIMANEGDSIGNTFYELQTYATLQNRIYQFEDGTIGTTYTIGYDWPGFSADRGTGYNYYNGSDWGEWSTERIESQRTGWSSYAPLGENGELIVAHKSGSGDEYLVFNKRISKGIGNWIESFFNGPVGHEDLLFPSMVTGGVNYNSVYLLSLTRPYLNGGSIYEGMDGALVYSRSSDSGETWDILNQILPGMDSSEYTGFTRDSYTLAEPKDNIVAFVCGSYQHDLFLMKSTDYGQTFEKTIIWDHPYDMMTPSFQTDTFYCVDGSLDVEVDMNGKAHVVFGIIRTYYNISNQKWRFYKLTDGIGYWNESMNTFSSNINALNPTSHPDSELIKDETLIGWAQDMDGDSIITYLDEPTYLWHYYSLGISSMVQLVSDEQNRLFLLYSSLTETYDNGVENYRRIWLRSSLNGGQTWGQFYHLIPNNPMHIWYESVFPSLASSTEEFIFLTYHYDYEPGFIDEGPYGEIFIQFTKIPKDEIVGIKQTKQENPKIEVSQNFPNPFSESTSINVNLRKPANLKLEVHNLVGRKVYEIKSVMGQKGLNSLTINRKELKPGVYFYTVKVDEYFITKKMIVR